MEMQQKSMSADVTHESQVEPTRQQSSGRHSSLGTRASSRLPKHLQPSIWKDPHDFSKWMLRKYLQVCHNDSFQVLTYITIHAYDPISFDAV
jgi:hypothetical protein